MNKKKSCTWNPHWNDWIRDTEYVRIDNGFFFSIFYVYVENGGFYGRMEKKESIYFFESRCVWKWSREISCLFSPVIVLNCFADDRRPALVVGVSSLYANSVTLYVCVEYLNSYGRAFLNVYLCMWVQLDYDLYIVIVFEVASRIGTLLNILSSASTGMHTFPV